ncbi:protein kinase [Actinosynnema sp. NPDC053489]|uniref:serine/threonine-protein kinase n=1 Tax=Actinosynnema sp. NPDC053489 TaxID=3363916 RepID=UPI0037CA91B3
MAESGGTEAATVGGRYALIERIGSGAMGVVWRARDELLDREVAVKRLRWPDLTADAVEVARARAMREARNAARLQHPDAISVFDVVVEDDRPWLVMEYLPSRSLAGLLAERGGVSPEEAARIGGRVAAALAAAHAADIVHRDVKPSNVLIGHDGTVKLTDFGISRAAGDGTLTDSGMITGTPAYLAPEVARGEQPDQASDVFSLGATLYAATEGRSPHGVSDNNFGLLYRAAAGLVEPPTRSGALTGVLLRLLSADPARRPTAAEAVDLLTAHAPRASKEGAARVSAQVSARSRAQGPARGAGQGSARGSARDRAAGSDRASARDRAAGSGQPSTRNPAAGSVQPSARDQVGGSGQPSTRNPAADSDRPSTRGRATGSGRPSTRDRAGGSDRPSTRNPAAGPDRPSTPNPAPGPARSRSAAAQVSAPHPAQGVEEPATEVATEAAPATADHGKRWLAPVVAAVVLLLVAGSVAVAALRLGPFGEPAHTSEEARALVERHYELLPEDTPAAYDNLAATFRQPFEEYQRFWEQYDDVRADQFEVVPGDGDRFVVRARVTFRRGPAEVAGFYLMVVEPVDGRLRISSSEQLT